MSSDNLLLVKDEKIKLLTEELESIKLVAAYMETQREEELAFLRKRYDEEISSLQHIVREVNQHVQNGLPNINSRHPPPPSFLHNSPLDHISPSLNSPDKESVLTKVRTVLQKRSPQLEGEDLEISQLKAKEHADMLRAIVTPFEEEISDLQRQLVFYKSQYERKNPLGTSQHFESSDSELDEQFIDPENSNNEPADALMLFPSSASTGSLATVTKRRICDSCIRLTAKYEPLESDLQKLSLQVSRLQDQLRDRDRGIEEDMRREVERSNSEAHNLRQKLTELSAILVDSQKQFESLKKLHFADSAVDESTKPAIPAP